MFRKDDDIVHLGPFPRRTAQEDHEGGARHIIGSRPKAQARRKSYKARARKEWNNGRERKDTGKMKKYIYCE